MIFSVIEIETWKRCRRKWDFQSDNRQNLESRRHAAPLVVGSAVHETLEIKTNEPASNVAQVFAAKAEAALDIVEGNYVEEVGAGMSPDEAQPIYEGLKIGLKMMEAYEKYYPTPLPEHYKPVRTEQRMIVAVPGTEHWECNNCHWIDLETPAPRDQGTPLEQVYNCRNPRYPLEPSFSCPGPMTWQPYYLRGTVDTLVQDTRSGKLLVLERKTYGVRQKVEKLQNDTQMIAYEWILMMLFGWENVGGTLYDGIWKRDYTSEYFRKKYKLADLFFRHRFMHPLEQVLEYASYLPTIMREMACAAPQDLYYNRRWEGCYDCGMQQLCEAMSRGEDVDYIRDTYYRQRRDASRFADPEGTDGG